MLESSEKQITEDSTTNGTNKGSAEISKIQYLKGVGPKRAEALQASGIHTPKDLLFYFPTGYIDRSTSQSLRVLKYSLQSRRQEDIFETEIKLETEITVIAWMKKSSERTFGNGKKFVVITIEDESGSLADLVFFQRVEYFSRLFFENAFVAVSGKPEWNERFGKLNFTHPEVEFIESDDEEDYRKGVILPKYTITQQMRKVGLGMRVLRGIIQSIVEQELPKVTETLPESLRNEYSLVDIHTAMRHIHFPMLREDLDAARNRMKFEEMLYFQVLMALRKHGVKEKEIAYPIEPKSKLARNLINELPFSLTNAQKRVVREIFNDMSTSSPMNRLLQGDVGSGKTIVATLAMIAAAESGFQSVLMAPTEILAEQHYKNISKILEPIGLKAELLLGALSAKARRYIQNELEENKIQILIGTHALFQESIHYNRLNLVVIDEQHRFGVAQRAELKKKAIESFKNNSVPNLSPHILVMSATPIPRTLSMSVHGDLDVSVINELPKSRKPIKTKVEFESNLQTVYSFIREEIQKGRQAYIVYPLVEKSEKLELKAAQEEHQRLQEEVFPDLQLGLLHGQMHWNEKEDVMKEFKDGKYNILVATTVVEVGIDVPNASVMVIEHAERFGLSQLHQLRGRVGRGAEQSYCLLIAKDHFKFHIGRKNMTSGERKSAIIRLQTMQDTTDGFKIAEVDLQLRGPGDFLGTKQSGLPDLTFTDITSDYDIIEKAKYAAEHLVRKDPRLSEPEYEVFRKEFLRRYQNNYGYVDIA